MDSRWFVNRTNKEYINYLSKVTSLTPAVTQILINRGLKTASDISDFLNPRLTNLSDPFELSGVEIAVERIREALRRNERVLVHGDYDADGLVSTAIMVHALRQLGSDVHYFIPHRALHGYGFNPSGLQRAKEIGASLVITVDCGITSFDTVALSKKEGIDVIITDHHEPQIVQSSKLKVQSYKPEKNETCEFLLPDAVAIVNPKLSTINFQLSTLSGAGVTFKIVHALSTIYNSQLAIHDYLDLVTVGTIADAVPLTGENRIIVKEGLKLIGNGTRPGLISLKMIAGIHEKEVKSNLLLFTIIPRINAAGRVSDANNVIKLLLSDSIDEALEISSWLDMLNSERQKIEEEIYQEAIFKLNSKGIRSAIVLSSEGWHPGIIGIIASKIAETYYRPTFIIFSLEGKHARGSARSIPPFDIYRGLALCKEFLTDFGGHRQAAGFRLNAKDIPYFEEKINKIVNETLTENDLTPSIEIDADVNLSHINFKLINELSLLEPIGPGNPEPLLGSKGLEVFYPRVVGSNHLKMKLRQQSCSIDAIGFDMAGLLKGIEDSTMIDAVFTPFINEWEGTRRLQLNLKAIRTST
ncbi:MAG: single-stranded-DNA-specific exonuclease RecJ [Thermodesulfovibrionales bacterium]